MTHTETNGTTPPGFPVAPGRLPVIGHVGQALDDPLAMLRRAEAACGPLFWVHLGFGVRYLFYVGNEALDVLRNPDVAVDYHGFGGDLARDSMLACDGPAHRTIRSRANPALAPRGLAASTGAAMARVADATAERWSTQPSVAVLRDAKHVALSNVLAAIGADPSDAPAWGVANRLLFSALFPVPVCSTVLAGLTRAWVDRRLETISRAAESVGRAPALLASLVAAAGSGEISWNALIGNLRLLTLAGHETQAAVVAWALIRATSDAALWSRLVAECAGSPTPRSHDEATRFPVAEALFRECARYYPPLWLLTRRTTRETTIGGRAVPRDTPIALSLLSMNRDPATFPDPDRFDIDRWIGRKPTTAEMVAFGGGPHLCIGYSMAVLAGVQALVSFVRESNKRGRTPRLRGALPRHKFVLTGGPPAATRIDLATRHEKETQNGW